MEEQATAVVEVAAEYVGRWNRLVSTTNWEKGRIIVEWREALEQAGAAAGDFSDDAWSSQVGGVSPQHVGRLRRVYERFGAVHKQYAGLYWSHFQAALDWPDAEMYLEGAVQNEWSVARMRNQRWEVLGGRPELKPRDEDVVASELDEDFSPTDDGPPAATISESLGEVHGADDLSDFDDRSDAASFDVDEPRSGEPVAAAADVAAPPVRPFESLPPLPPDLNEAFELFKLAILNHKVSGWREIARSDVLSVLESLRQLALAPAE
jgi:hypothetical protein